MREFALPTGIRERREVSGRLTIDEMLAVANNGVAAGEWDEVLSLIRAGRTYANVHSGKFPGGEVRAQLDNGDDDQDDHGHRALIAHRRETPLTLSVSGASAPAAWRSTIGLAWCCSPRNLPRYFVDAFLRNASSTCFLMLP